MLKCGDTQTIYESGRSNSANMIFFSTGNPLPSGFNSIPKFRSDLLKWVRLWERAGTVVEKLRHADLDDVNVQQTIKNLDDAFKSALIHSPLKL